MRSVVAVGLLWSGLAVADDLPTSGSNDVGKTIVRELANSKAERGVEHVVAQIPVAKLDAVKAALASAQLAVIAEYVEDGTTYITVEAKDGGRARLELAASSGQLWVIPKPSTTKLSGRCVAVPKVEHPIYLHGSAIDQSGEMHQSTNLYHFKTRRLADVDGDGILDAFVPKAKKPGDCPELVAFTVYAMRGTCGHAIGVVGPGSVNTTALHTAPVDASGFKPITTSAQETVRRRAIPELFTTARSFAVKAGAYAETSKDRRGGKCHHCATWHCTAAKP